MKTAALDRNIVAHRQSFGVSTGGVAQTARREPLKSLPNPMPEPFCPDAAIMKPDMS